jgi:hypothetical protein
MARKPGAVALTLLLALAPAPVRAATAGGGSASDVNDLDRLATDSPAFPAASGDCPVEAITLDPDGMLRRFAVSRATHLLAASHPMAPSTPAPIDKGLTGIVFRMPRNNYIDDEVFGAMQSKSMTPAPLSSDSEFLRRVTIDLTGRIPDEATVTSFLNDATPDKRSRMIDTLLNSNEFVDRWAFFYDELFQNTAFASSARLYTPGRNAWHAYFQDAIRSHKPYDQMARELIAGAGDTAAAPAANYAARSLQVNGPIQDTYDNLGADTGTIFLGTNALFCTSCHNGAGHLDQINLWGSTVRRQDFWGISAFYSRTTIRRQGTQQSDYTYAVGDAAAGDYLLNTTTGNKTPRVPCTDQVTTNCNGYGTYPPGLTSITPTYLRTPTNPQGGAPMSSEGYRAAMGRLITADPQFARAAVNYLWREMFTVGIVEPANSFDLMRQDPSNPPPGTWTIQPTLPNLLTRLAQDYAGHGYDLRHVLGLIAKSNAYQLSSFYPGTWSDAYAPYFARHFARRMTAEEIFDAITKATGVAASIPVTGFPGPVAWAMQLPDVQEPGGRSSIGNFLNTFLRGDRDQDARSNEFSISQALLLLNDANVTSRIRSTTPGSAVNRLIASNATPGQIVTSLYLSTLSRNPTASELTAGIAMLTLLQPGQTKASAAEDLQFALLNKLDFFITY